MFSLLLIQKIVRLYQREFRAIIKIVMSKEKQYVTCVIGK